MSKSRKLKKGDLDKFKKKQSAAEQLGDGSGNRDHVQGVYKIWSAFTKTLRAVVLKNPDEDIVIKTRYFGKFFVTKLDTKAGSKAILY